HARHEDWRPSDIQKRRCCAGSSYASTDSAKRGRLLSWPALGTRGRHCCHDDRNPRDSDDDHLVHEVHSLAPAAIGRVDDSQLMRSPAEGAMAPTTVDNSTTGVSAHYTRCITPSQLARC